MKLPPDPEKQNDQRSAQAQLAIDAYAQASGSEPEHVLSDLLASLAHWCDRNCVHMDAILDAAAFHYREETGNKGQQLSII